MGTSSSPVASIVSNTLCAACQEYSIARRSSGDVPGAVYKPAGGAVETWSSEEAVQDEDVEGEQHQRPEVQEVFGDATRFDVSEVGERLGIIRIRQAERDHDDDRADQRRDAGQGGHPTPSAQLTIAGPAGWRQPVSLLDRRCLHGGIGL